MNHLTDSDEKRSGFFDLEEVKICKHPSHEPPEFMHIPQGKAYKHVCPACGEEHIMIPQQFSFQTSN